MYIGKKRIIVFMVLACGITWTFNVIQSLLDITEAPLAYLFIAPAVFGPAVAALIALHKKVSLRDYIRHCFTFAAIGKSASISVPVSLLASFKRLEAHSPEW